uniref:Uncharacterized protein n=1 Tax=Rhizophagus irregularis (strain DAOM 181602 / DAOM 197198 / MUCL 43194) TaxID=747089 RepID=U9TXI6_RHIID
MIKKKYSDQNTLTGIGISLSECALLYIDTLQIIYIEATAFYIILKKYLVSWFVSCGIMGFKIFFDTSSV